MPVKRQHADGDAAPKRTRFATSPPAHSSSSGAPRSGPSKASYNRGSSSSASASRSRDNHADEEEEDLLAADLPEGAQRAKQKDKRQLAGKHGYDSDSSNDEDGVVFSRRKDKGNKGGDGDGDEDEDLDMFGAGSDDEDAKGKGKGKEDKGKAKEKEFLDLEDIMYQEDLDVQKKGGIHSDDEDEDDVKTSKRRAAAGQDVDMDAEGEYDGSDEEAIEARRAAKRFANLNGDMGFELTGFNMKDEMEEGRFTADGETYVANAKDEGEKHDQWLTEVDDEAILKARRAHKEREQREEQLQKEEADGVASEENRKKEEGLMREAVGLMERGETVLEALQRLGAEVERKRKEEGRKKSWAERQKERKAHQDGSESNPFTQLTNIVSALSITSQLDVYSLSRESIQRMLPTPTNGATGNGGTSGQNTPPIRDTRSFQYRFSMGYVRNLPEAQRPVEREVFGPFPVQQLSQWRNTGFFGGPACENVELRVAGPDPGPWGSWEAIVGK